MKENTAGLEENIADDVFIDKLNNIRETIRIIDSDIESRQSLSKNLLEQTAKEKSKFLFYVQELKWCFPGYNAGLDSMRNHFMTMLFSLEKEERTEKVHCLKDVTQLRQRQIEKFEEYRGLIALSRSMAVEKHEC